MKHSRLLGGAILVVLLAFPSIGVAQELDTKSIVGTWRGTSPSPAGGEDRR